MARSEIKVTDMTRPDARLFRELCANPALVRAIFEAAFYPAPWMGWVPMACEIMRMKGKAP